MYVGDAMLVISSDSMAGLAISAAIYRGATCPTLKTAEKVSSGSR